MTKLKKEIKSILTNIVGEDLGSKIFKANFPKPIINYKRGKVFTFKELKELPSETMIHIYYLDEDNFIREDGFHKLCKNSIEEYSGGGFSFPMDEYEDENELVKDQDNCDWTFTISEAIKISKSEYDNIQKEKEKSIRAIELIEKLQNKELLTKEEKKELKKITGINIR